MTLLVIGRGAEDVEDEVGRLVVDLNGLMTSVIGLDLDVTTYTCLSGEPSDVVSWVRSQYSPKLVVVIDPPESAVFGPAVAVPVAVRTSRAATLTALRAWRAEQDATALTGDAALLHDALRTAFGRNEARPSLRDRAPRVSLLVAVHNQERYLHRTLQSVLADTYDDFEVVAVDDGSTDASPEIMRQYEGDPRLRVVTQPNVGGTGRMDLVWNRGLRAARGELIAFLGGDDVSLPHRLSAQVDAFDDDPELGICHSATHNIDSAGTRLGHGLSLPVPYDELSFLRSMLKTNLVAHPTAMISRRTFERIGPFEEGLACDYHYWMKAAGRTRFRYLPQRLVEYRIHDRSLSTTLDGSARCAAEAHRHRQIVARRRGLVDFFPELEGSVEPRAWQEAGIAIGNTLVHLDPTLALHAYDMASDALPSPVVEHNRVVALFAAGDRDAALRVADAAAGLDPRISALAAAIRAGEGFEVSLLSPETHLVPALVAGRMQKSAIARAWDGSPVGYRTAYVALDPGQSAVGEVCLEDWSRLTCTTSAMRWVYPDLGIGLDETLRLLASASGRAGDLSLAADLVIDIVDDFALLPPDPSRPEGVIRDREHADHFRSWLAANV